MTEFLPCAVEFKVFKGTGLSRWADPESSRPGGSGVGGSLALNRTAFGVDSLTGIADGGGGQLKVDIAR